MNRLQGRVPTQDLRIAARPAVQEIEFFSFAQNFEDVMLHRALRGVTEGFYIDVGAADPTINSVTAAFYTRGWRGVNIEPDTRRYSLLASLRPRDTNLNVAVGQHDAEGILFYQVEEPDLSTCDPGVASWHRDQGMKVEQRSIPVRSLSSICRQQAFQGAIHFLKIDVEGFEKDVLLGADFGRHRPWIVVVESTRPMSQEASHHLWEDLLLSAGYVFRYFDGLNRFYVRADLNETIGNAFSVPPNAFDYFVRVGKADAAATFEALQQVDQISCLLSRSEQLRGQLQIKLEEAEDRILAAHRWEHLAHQYYGETQLLRASNSWRITSPLRKTATVARNGLHNCRVGLDRIGRARAPNAREKHTATATNQKLPWTFDIIGHINGSYSLAEANRAITCCLMTNSGAAVRLTPIEDGAPASVDAVEATEKSSLEAAVEINIQRGSGHIAIVQHYPIYVPRGSFDLRVLILPWEEGLVPFKMVETINARFDAVFAYTKVGKKVLTDSGVALPVSVINYPGNFAKFRSVAAARASASTHGIKSEITFLHVSSCFPRKGADVLIDSFTEAFTANDPVRLIIKGFPNPHNKVADVLEERARTALNVAPITLINEDINHEALLALYRQADAIVLPTRGEGLNLPAAEALAAGLPLIVTGYGGQSDFVDGANVRLLDYRFVQSESHVATLNSVWCEPSRKDLVRALRDAFTEIKNQRASDSVRDAWPGVASWFDGRAFARRFEAAIAAVQARPRAQTAHFAWVSTFDVKCGIAEYSKQLIAPLSGMGSKITVLCDDRTAVGQTAGSHAVIPAWTLANRSAERLISEIVKIAADTIVVQHHPGLMPWSFIETLFSASQLGRCVRLITLHNVKGIVGSPQAEVHAAHRALRLADRVLVHSVYDLNLLKSLGLVTNVSLFPQGVTVFHGAEPRQSENQVTAPVIGGYGFVLPHKGFGLLIESLVVLRRRWPSAALRLVTAEYPSPSSSAELRRCRELAERLGVAEAIEWITEFLPQEESVRLLSSCDLVVLPYKATNEASSAAVRTALSSKRPVAVTPLRIFEDLGEAVYRFKGCGPAEIAAGLSSLLREPLSRKSLIDAADHWMEAHSWTALGCRLHGMVLGLLSDVDGCQPESAPSRRTTCSRNDGLSAGQDRAKR